MFEFVSVHSRQSLSPQHILAPLSAELSTRNPIVATRDSLVIGNDVRVGFR